MDWVISLEGDYCVGLSGSADDARAEARLAQARHPGTDVRIHTREEWTELTAGPWCADAEMAAIEERARRDAAVAAGRVPA